jgi:hypothetical protein
VGLSLRRKLEAWRKAGLLDVEQAARLARYEDQHSGGAQRVVWGISAVGGLAIAGGIISVVAAHWDNIPELLKLLACGALLLGSLGGAWFTARLGSSWPRDLFLLFHGGMVLAAVGLVAQIYHLHSHPWRALALCAIFALPAAAIAVHGLLTDAAIAYVTLSMGFFLSERGWFDHCYRDFGVGFLEASLGLAFLLGAQFIQPLRSTAAAALRRWGVGLMGVVAIAACVLWNTHPSWPRSTDPRGYGPMGVFAVAALVCAGWEMVGHKPGRNARLLALALLGALLAGAALTYSDGALGQMPRQFVGFGLFCALCATLAVAAASAGSRFGTNLATLALAGRILALYFELAKDLMTTGVGLIVTGGVCLGIAYGWWRFRSLLPVAPRLDGAA